MAVVALTAGVGSWCVVGCGSTGSNTSSNDGGGASSDGAACPTTLPAAGAHCDLADGTPCSYACASATPGNALCSRGSWIVTVTDLACKAEAGPPPADAPFACGSTTCGVTQYCVHPCCGGAPLQCFDMTDAGTCPPGSHPGSCTPPSGGATTGCEADPCTPPPPYCVDSPDKAGGCSVPTGGSESRDLSCECA